MNFAFRQAGYDLTIEQFTIMADLSKEDGLSQQTFADRSSKNKASITSLINNLEKKGWVSRKSDRRDRRSKRIHLTKKGTNVYAKLSPIVEQTFTETLESLSEKDMTTGMEILYSLVHSLQDEFEETPEAAVNS